MNTERRIRPVPVWQAHWSTERLRQEQADNPRAFSRGFQMRAFSDEERMFPSFQTCYSHGVVIGEIARREWPVFCGVDLAGKARPGNVIFVAAIDPATHRRYPLEVLRGGWKSPETAAHIAGVNERYPTLSIIMVENNGYQQSLVDWCQSDPRANSFWYKIESYTTGFASKVDPTFGLPSLEVEFKNKAWVVPIDEFESHAPQCRCGWCVWNEEAKDYPMGKSTDCVMAMFFTREAIARWGASVLGRAAASSVGDLSNR